MAVSVGANFSLVARHWPLPSFSRHSVPFITPLKLCSFITQGRERRTNENSGVSVSQAHTLTHAFVAVAVIKHLDKKQLWEKGFVSARQFLDRLHHGEEV